MKGIGAAVVVSLATWSAADPAFASWVYVVLIVVLAQLGFYVKISAAPRDPVPVGEPPYEFSAEEARVVERFRYYFTNPVSAREIASTLSAMGITALLLSPWLVYKQQLIQAILVGLSVLTAGPMTKILSPVYTLRLAAHKGDAEDLRIAKAFDTAWEKIRRVREILDAEGQGSSDRGSPGA